MANKTFFTEEKSLITGETSKNKQFDSDKVVYDGEELFKLKITTIPCLVEPIIPKEGVIALVGSSDVGKSTLLLQLCCDIVLNEEFIGFPITAKYKRAIYVSTEDDKDAISFRLQKLKENDIKELKNLRFIFDTDNLLENLEKLIIKERVDLVVIDTFTDIYTGEMNQINKVRSFMNEYHNLAKKYECLIVFNHHTGKYTEEKPPSKNNSIGSAGFEGKARLVMELRQDFSFPDKRHLCIVKGNYLGSEYKDSSFELEFDQTSGYVSTGNREYFSSLVKPKPGKVFLNRDVEKKIAYKLHLEGKSSREISTTLEEMGYKVSKSTVAEWINSLKAVSDQNTV